MASQKQPKRVGQATIEFALVILILSVVLMGIFDLGRIIYTTASLSNAAREGARVAAVTSSITAIDNAVISRGVGLNIQQGQILAPIYCTAPDCSATTTNRTDDTAVAVKITISNYPFTAITPFIGNIFGPSGTMYLSSSASMTLEKP